MKEFPLISVIVPIYNVELYLRECIESILNQCYQELEVILVDDGSTDGCHEICKEYEKLDKRIKLISKENGGVVSARKIGLLAAKGEYIGYVDADDWIDEEMYQKMYEEGIEKGADLICVSSYKIYANGMKEKYRLGLKSGLYDKNDVRKLILPNWIKREKFFEWLVPLQPWRHLCKRELLWNNQLKVDDRIVMGEDIACFFPCYLQTERLCIIDKCLYNYRQRNNSAKTALPEKKNIGYKILYKQICQCIEEFGFIGEVLKQQACFVLYFIMLMASNYLFLENDDSTFPFNVPRHSKVVIYGAGVFGKNIYSSFKEMDICNIQLWVDSDYKKNKNVVTPMKILEEEYDYVLLAVLNAKTRDSIRMELINLGVSEKKIADIDLSLFTYEYLEKILNYIR